MKIIQITDTHVVPEQQRLHGLDPKERLQACIEDIRSNHKDAALCVLTGDLAHKGEVSAYRVLKTCLQKLPIPFHLLVGNHDDRENLRSIFPEVATDPNGYIQSVLDYPEGRLVLLDTLEAGQKYGSFCGARTAWLRDRLEEADGRPTYLFMHHPPFAIGIPAMDRIRLCEGSDLLTQTIRSFDNVRHIFFGHVHRPIAGSWHGIPISALRGTNHQVALDMIRESPITRSHEPPAYGVITLHSESTIVHYHDYLDDTRYFV